MSLAKNTWVYPGFNTVEELVNSGHRYTHFLFMFMVLKEYFQEKGEDEFLRNQIRMNQEYFIRHQKHFEMIIKHFGCPGEIHNFFLSWDALLYQIYQISEEIHPGDDDYYLSINQENDFFHKVHQLIHDHKSDNGVVTQIKFIVQDPKGFSKTITVGDEVVEEILDSLKSLPQGKPLNRKRGRLKLTNQHEFYKRNIKACLEFVSDKFQQEFTLTDQLYFASLCISVVNLEYQSPLNYKESLQDYKDLVSDHLKYYLD
jgi:hypothetical protein